MYDSREGRCEGIEASAEERYKVDVFAIFAAVSAIRTYAKINDAGNWIERSESVNLTELFDKMSATELEEYARSGKLPNWFPVGPALPATGENGPEGPTD
jgi:hypothetical protein